MKKLFLALNMIILISTLNSAQVSANNYLQFNLSGSASGVVFENDFKTDNSIGFSVKSDGKYDESKDPLYRRGTQNTDTPQGIFFALPIILTVLCFIVLFAKKK
jgi:hypothetical protein